MARPAHAPLTGFSRSLPGKIAIEEHFVTRELEDLVLNPGWPDDAFRRTLDRLEDVEGERLELMDRFGIDVQVLSLASDGIQGVDDASAAVRRASEANDALAGLIASRPDRFAGFAAVALQEVASLWRCKLAAGQVPDSVGF